MEGAPWGGSEELWSQSAAQLAREGMAVGVNVVAWPQVPNQIKALQAAGCNVVRRPHPKLLMQKAKRRLMGEGCYRWLDQFRPDFALISQGSNFDGIHWMQQCARRGIPFASITQMANENYWPPLDTAKLAAEVYSQAQACFFVSRGNLELTEKQIACRLPSAQVVWNPVNVSYDAKPHWPVPQDTFSLACVGRLAPCAKGQDILLDVMALEKWRNRPIAVTLFGEGYGRENITKRIEMLNLANVTMGGFVSDIETIWSTHHALVMASRYEGLPLAVVEAMLCARFCVVTDVAGNAELIEDNVSGFVAAAPKAKCLDEAMERAWQVRSEWQQIGQAAATKVRALVPRDPIAAFVNQIAPLMAQ